MPIRKSISRLLGQKGELLQQLTERFISESIRGSILGLLWLVLNPLLSMAMYVVVFGVIFGGKFGITEDESSIGYAVGVYIGITMVNLINDTLARSTSIMVSYSNTIRKVVFPVYFLPIAQVLCSTFKYLVNMVIWLIAGLIYGNVLRWEVVYVPVIVFPMVILAMGLALFVAAFSVYFRDAQQLTTFVNQIVFWSSGVFFSAQQVMEIPQVWAILKWNPVLLAIENIRMIVLWNSSPDWIQVSYLYFLGIICLFFGGFVFSRLKAGFSDFL